MIENINNKQVSDILKESSFKRPDSANSPTDKQLDALLEVQYASLIEQATQSPTENPSAVERARQLLLSGQLDSPENIRAAAEAILKFGI